MSDLAEPDRVSSDGSTAIIFGAPDGSTQPADSSPICLRDNSGLARTRRVD
jgi:hypothetical protein